MIAEQQKTKTVRIGVELHSRLVRLAEKFGYRIDALVIQGVEMRLKELERGQRRNGGA